MAQFGFIPMAVEPPFIKYTVTKPTGYSWFPHDIVPCPASWLAVNTNVVFVRYHESVCTVLLRQVRVLI